MAIAVDQLVRINLSLKVGLSSMLSTVEYNRAGYHAGAVRRDSVTVLLVVFSSAYRVEWPD